MTLTVRAAATLLLLGLLAGVWWLYRGPVLGLAAATAFCG